MNSKLLKIVVLGVTTLFLSAAPAFACAGVEKDADIGKTGQYLASGESSPSDQDMNVDRGDNESSNPTETEEPSSD